MSRVPPTIKDQLHQRDHHVDSNSGNTVFWILVVIMLLLMFAALVVVLLVVFVVGGAAIVFDSAIGEAQQAAYRVDTLNRARQISIAIHNYHDRHKSLPQAFSVNEQGDKLQSWRSMILEYTDEYKIAEQIDWKAPWDGSPNRQFHERVLEIYHSRNRGERQFEQATNFVAVVGPNTAIRGKRFRSA